MGARTDLVAAVDYSSVLLVEIHWSIFSLPDGNEKLWHVHYKTFTCQECCLTAENVQLQEDASAVSSFSSPMASYPSLWWHYTRTRTHTVWCLLNSMQLSFIMPFSGTSPMTVVLKTQPHTLKVWSHVLWCVPVDVLLQFPCSCVKAVEWRHIIIICFQLRVRTYQGICTTGQYSSSVLHTKNQ